MAFIFNVFYGLKWAWYNLKKRNPLKGALYFNGLNYSYLFNLYFLFLVLYLEKYLIYLLF